MLYESFQEQGQKLDKNYQKMTLGAWERNLSLVPGCPRITLFRAQEYALRVIKVSPRGPPQATHAPAWEI